MPVQVQYVLVKFVDDMLIMRERKKMTGTGRWTYIQRVVARFAGYFFAV